LALAQILEALRREGEEEIARIERERDEATAAILQSARDEAKRVEADAAIARDEALARETAIIRNRAELQVERRLQEAREDLFQEILGRAKDRLSRFRRDPDYPELLAELLDECTAFLGHVEVVALDPRDAALETQIREQVGPVQLDRSLDTWGGVIAHDGRGVYVRNTLEDRLRRAEADARMRIGDLVPGLDRRSEPGGRS
jgi:vacuolar-type H+-ATPase subunit E/Vma4